MNQLKPVQENCRIYSLLFRHDAFSQPRSMEGLSAAIRQACHAHLRIQTVVLTDFGVYTVSHVV